MTLGLRAILLIAAIILFIVAALVDENTADLIAIGLAAFAAAFLVEDVGVGQRLRNTRNDPAGPRP